MNSESIHRRRRRSSTVGRRIAAMLRRAVPCAACLAAISAGAAPPSARTAIDRLPPAVVKLLEAPPLATPSVDPTDRYLVLVRKRGLLDRSRLAAPTVLLAGRRVDPRTHGPHAPLSYDGFTVIDLASGQHKQIPLPRGATVGFPLWAPDGSRFAFTLTASRDTELWVADPAAGRAYRLVGGLNAIFPEPCRWLADSRHVICRRVAPAPRRATGTPLLPDTESADGANVYGGDTLSTVYVERMLESQLQSIDVVAGTRRDIGAPAAIESVAPAPSGAFLLVKRLVKPYPRIAGVDRAKTTHEIWDRAGRVVTTEPAGRRALQWQPARPATLVWAQRDAGRDRLMAQAAPFDAAPAALFVFATADRFAGVRWLENAHEALVDEYAPAQGQTREWLVDTRAGRGAPRQLGRSAGSEDAGDGFPLETRNRWGQPVVATDDGAFFVRGETSTHEGASAPYLDRITIATGARQRIWTRRSAGYETVVDTLSGDGHLLLTRYETADTPPNYYLTDTARGSRSALTHNAHPAPALDKVKAVPLQYKRADGTALSATLYVPPGAKPKGALPAVLWAYPTQVDTAPKSADSPSIERYMGSARALRLFFLLCGYAVLDDVSMPIVGNDAQANDSFVKQVVANARAAVDAAAATGYVDRNRVAVAGHSYGAFMVANLLAHSHLFRAGAALSGAYNRTLTPFGFQTERRTLWQAPQTYLSMSPLLYSNRIEAPLLLVHGLADDNAGTPPIQSIQFYRAIRGTGGDAQLVLLPWEGHTYRSRQSVLETAASMLDWFDRFLKAPAHETQRGDSRETSAALIKLVN